MTVWPLAREDLRLALRDRSGIFWIFIAPLIWVYFFGLMAQSSKPGDVQINLTVIREDPSERAGEFIEYLKGENLAIDVVGKDDAGDRRAGPRVLTIPADFDEAIAARRKIELPLRLEGAANTEGTLMARVALHRAVIRLLADEAFGPAEAADDRVVARTHWATQRVAPSGYYQSVPGNLVMFVLLATMTGGSALLAVERRSGLLSRLASSPLTRTEIIAGKLLGRMAIAAVQTGVFLVIGLLILRIDWGNSPSGLAALLGSFILCAAALSLLGGSLFASPGAASGVGVVISLVMSALGGCWWPAEVMPEWMRVAARAVPASWAMNGLHELISWGGGLGDVVVNCLALLAFAAGALLLAARRLKVMA